MLGMWQGAANALRAKKVNKELGRLLAQDPSYQKNPLAAEQFGLAQQLFNGRMPGAASLERNIYQNQANTINSFNKNATDSSQALALAAQAQNQSNNAFANLNEQEAQNKQSMLSNLNNAYAGMIGEDDKVYNDKIRRFGNLASIRGQQQQNKTNAINGIFNGINSDINQAIQIAGMAMGMPTAGMGGGGFSASQLPDSSILSHR
jgi:hypothetical protein